MRSFPPDQDRRFGTVAIVGVGLIGGSIGLALKQDDLARRVLGLGRDPERLEQARRLGAIDAGVAGPPDASVLAEADVVVICTPVTRIASDAIEAASHGRRDLLITDAGSTKRTIVEAVEADPRAREAFVGAHPMAGSERKGAAHARADLFRERVCVLTPTASTPPDRLTKARAFWSSLGCRLLEMDPESHDRAVAACSHLPHAVAWALAAVVPETTLPLAAGAFRDGTRVAASDPALWAGIFLHNRDAVLDVLDRYRDRLDAFRAALEAEDADALARWCQPGRERRLAFEAGHDPGRATD